MFKKLFEFINKKLVVILGKKKLQAKIIAIPLAKDDLAPIIGIVTEENKGLMFKSEINLIQARKTHKLFEARLNEFLRKLYEQKKEIVSVSFSSSEKTEFREHGDVRPFGNIAEKVGVLYAMILYK